MNELMNQRTHKYLTIESPNISFIWKQNTRIQNISPYKKKRRGNTKSAMAHHIPLPIFSSYVNKASFWII